jgi:hypothetical protein
LKIARADKDFAYTSSGLEGGALIVVSSLDMATDGMVVRTQANDVTDGRRITQGGDAPGKSEAN